MKRLSHKIIGTIIGLMSALPVVSHAYSLTFDPGGVLQTKSKLGNQNPGYIVFTIINFALIFLGAITVILIIIAGFQWILAGGEEEKIKKAKELLKGSVLGLVIVMSSYGLAQFIFSLLQTAIIGT